MYPDENRDEAKPVEAPQSQSLKATKVLHSLVTQLEDRLAPVLRPANGTKETANPEPVKSELMQELAYLQNHLNFIIERLHI